MRKTNLLLALAAALTVLAVCPGLALAYSGTLTKNLTITWDSETREYYRYVPNNMPTSDVPLVVVLHGGGQDLEKVISQAPKQWMELADDDKFIVVYPHGLGNHWNDCRSDHTGSTAEDVGFIGELIDTIAGSYNIDTDKVYATGASNGGMMSYRLARELSSQITAVGAVVGNNPENDECDAPSGVVPVLIMNGTSDPLMPWNGGCIKWGGNCNESEGYVVSADDTVDFWVDFLNCETTPTSRTLTNVSSTDGCTVSKLTYPNGDSGSELVLYRVNSGGHTYPTIDWPLPWLQRILLGLGNENHDIEGVDYIWEFFQAH